jgi:GT2 family glycosyltransferase
MAREQERTAPAPARAISAVICAYTERRWDDIVAAVESLREQTVPTDEIILVIDHNQDLLQRAVRDLDSVAVIPNDGPRGLSGARNAGIARATGQVVLFLDDDAVAAPDWSARLCRWLSVPTVLGAGGASLPLWSGSIPRWLPEEFYWTVGCRYRGLPEQVSQVRNLFGGCMAVRREVFEVAGGFSSGVGRDLTTASGCEETELCIRASQRLPDHLWLYDPEAVIHHRVPEDRTRWRYFIRRCYAEGKSKALVAGLVGEDAALSAERAYTFRVLPVGVVRGVLHALTGDSYGLLRSAAIVAGLGTTALGYAVTRFYYGDQLRAADSSGKGAPSSSGQPAGEIAE